MHLSARLAALAALVLRTTAYAVAVAARQDPHILDFRTFGAAGCFEQNQGVYTKLQSDLNVCRGFADATIGSLFVLDATAGCSLLAYPDAACSESPITVPVGIANCYDATAAGLSSYQVVCTEQPTL